MSALVSSLAVVLFAFSAVIANRRLRFISLSPTALGGIIFLNVFIMIVPGLFLVSLFGAELSFGVRGSISYEVIQFTFWYTLAGLSLLLLSLAVLSTFVDFDAAMSRFRADQRTAIGLVAVSIALIVLKLWSIQDLPLVLAANGDSLMATEQKARILKGDVGFGGFLTGYLFLYFPLMTFVYLSVAARTKVIGRTVYWSYALIFFFYNAYDLQKYNFFFYFFVIFMLRAQFKRLSFVDIAPVVLVSTPLVLGSFMLLHDTALENVVLDALARTFIGQIEGSYLIYQALSPDVTRITYGMPLSALLGFSTAQDPAAEVVRIFFPTAGDAWINSNTFVLAHAWAIIGYPALLFMPLVLTVNILLLALFRSALSGPLGLIASSIYFTVILTLKINNDFSGFLYLKPVLAFVILAGFALVVKIISGFPWAPLAVRASIRRR